MRNQPMAMSFPSIFNAIIFFVLFSPSCQVLAQSCFYPNGDPSKEDDRPCSSEPGSACCPLNWQCLSNGLCYLENAGYYGRYTCTDRSWQSSGCPNICTHGNTASGNEAILECNSNNYCCDANRPTPGCCDTTNDRFQLQAGSVIASIGNDSPTAAAPVTPPNQPPTTIVPTNTAVQPVSGFSTISSLDSVGPTPVSPPASSSSASVAVLSSLSVSNIASQRTTIASSSTTMSDLESSVDSDIRSSTSPSILNQASSNPPRTVVLTSIVTKPSGGSSTIISSFLTTETPPSAAPASTTSSSSTSTSAPPSPKKNLGAIIGPAVAVPLALLALAGFAYFIWRRHKSKKRAAEAIAAEQSTYPYTGMSEMNSPASVWMPHTPEQTDRTAGIEVL